jgi:UDP-2-acetamido-2,6-beta-L-arabino-hexul-4-ose reductase
MSAILVTGSAGFVGKHAVEALRRRGGIRVLEKDTSTRPEAFDVALREADAIIHLAGVNRPLDVAEFKVGNTDAMSAMCRRLTELGRRPVIVFSSSIQAALDNPYGASKREAEQVLESWVREFGARAVVFRLKNVFGKGCRPNYNSVIATFCHNIARDLPITVSDESREMDLVYVDDVVTAMIDAAQDSSVRGLERREIPVSYRITLGRLATIIRGFRESRRSLLLPSFEDEFTRRLYATYLSYLEAPDFAYGLLQRRDERGCLAEFMKSAHFGQVFVSRTKPGVTRGNHYHHTKTEKFLVLEGSAIIRFRPIFGGRVIEHKVSGHDFRVVDIPPGYAHSIENIGSGELVTVFWASEILDASRPDTIAAPVLTQG